MYKSNQADNVWIMDDNIDLNYSPDDGVWYFLLHNNPDGKVLESKDYTTKAYAIADYNNELIIWM